MDSICSLFETFGADFSTTICSPPVGDTCFSVAVTVIEVQQKTLRVAERSKIFFQQGLQSVYQLWHQIKCVTHQAVIRNRKNRRIWVFVDGNNHFTVLHTRQMLNRT